MGNEQFYSDLAYSKAESRKPYWKAAYKRYFRDPHLTCELIEPMEKGQPDSGADKIITLSCGQQLTVDEKTSKGNFQDSEIFLEYEHEYDSGEIKDGWVRNTDKADKCDYIAYSKPAISCVYILPLRDLQLAFAEHEDMLQAEYPSFPARNESWTTYSIRLPVEAVHELLGRNYVIKVPEPHWQ